MEKRKQDEIDFHNKIREQRLKEDANLHDYYWSNRKFYSVTRSSRNYFHHLITKKKGRVLDYCCGDGATSIFLAKQGIEVTGIDISNVSIDNCKRSAISEGVTDKTDFLVMDAENTELPDASFDVIICAGVLHHLDVNRAFPELVRLLKPDGIVVAHEALANNPLIQWYRNQTPHLRTEWESEHILGLNELDLARQHFGQINLRYFHLAVLAAVPFRNTPLFRPLLSALEFMDDILLRLPVIQTQSWQMIFTLSQPGKPSPQYSFVESEKNAEKLLFISALALGLIGLARRWVSHSK